MERWEELIAELRSEFLLREEELGLLHDIDLQLLETERPLNTTFDLIIHRTQELINSDHMHILIRRGRFLEGMYSTSNSDLGQQVDIANSLTGQCFSHETALNVADVTAQPWRESYVPIAGYDGPPMRSLLAMPIKVHDTIVGVLNSESIRPNAFTPVHEKILKAISSQVAMALQRAQLFDRNALFAEVDQLIFSDSEDPDVVQLALEKVLTALHDLEHVQLTTAQICFYNEKGLEVVHSNAPEYIGLIVEIDESVCGRAVREKRTIIVDDVSKEPDFRRLFGFSIQSEIAIPILLEDNDTVIGVINLESEELGAFRGFSQVILESFANKVRMLLAFAKLRSDVTEAIELRNASDLLVAVGDQASNMIHRMNNTVGAMRFRIRELQDLLDDGGLEHDDFLVESLERLLSLADRTLQMPDEVTQLLNQQSSTVDVNNAIERVLTRIQIPENVRLDLDFAPDLPLLSLYCFDIVVLNLVQNAIDAMPRGGFLTIATSSVSMAELPTGYVQVTVRDTGSGIPKEIITNVFDLNFTTKKAKGKGLGLGLGLWWVRNFVRRANGDITVSSTVDKGSQFIVRLPFERAAAEALTEEITS